MAMMYTNAKGLPEWHKHLVYVQAPASGSGWSLRNITYSPALRPHLLHKHEELNHLTHSWIMVNVDLLDNVAHNRWFEVKWREISDYESGWEN